MLADAVSGPVCGLAWTVTAGLIGGAVTLWQWNRVDDEAYLQS